MKRKRFVLLAILLLLGLVASANAVQEEDESFGQKIKKLFSTPTPPPKKHSKSSPSPSPKHKKTSKTSPSPKPSAKPSPKSTPTPTPSPSPTAEEEATAKPSETPSETPAVTPRSRKIRGEAVRAISPGPNQKHVKTPPEGVSIPKASASPTESVIAEKSPRPKASKTPSAVKSPEVEATRETGRTSSIAADRISRYDENEAPVRKVLDRALGLTTQNLTYKYGSADPASGGMDCSGFVYYVLKESGLKDVPRDAREQYIWVRKAGTFQAVLGHSEDTFELEALKPGDLLFWAGTYHTDKDPAITHTMIYLGREKGTNQRIMVGSSDGRTYKGQSRFGVSVFDFHVATHKRVTENSEDQATPVFVGYGRVPGLDAAR
jgi:cell wall-associated NlpC family hydrolase